MIDHSSFPLLSNNTYTSLPFLFTLPPFSLPRLPSTPSLATILAHPHPDPDPDKTSVARRDPPSPLLAIHQWLLDKAAAARGKTYRTARIEEKWMEEEERERVRGYGCVFVLLRPLPPACIARPNQMSPGALCVFHLRKRRPRM